LHQEQSDLDEGMLPDDLDQARPSNFYIGKNKVTKCSKKVLFSVTSNSFIFVTDFFFIITLAHWQYAAARYLVEIEHYLLFESKVPQQAAKPPGHSELLSGFPV
jgi:hypothetical protein